MTPELTFEDRRRLRQLLDQMDLKEAGGGTKEFDLNKPPQQRYVYQEYPFLMYDHEEGKTKSARNLEERQKMMAEGWSESPVPSGPQEMELTDQERAEAEVIDKQLTKKRRS